jgi:predicted RNase H-like HicB family nuclease
MIKSKEKYVKYYSYLVEYSWEDEAYIGKCRELGIMIHGDSQKETLLEIKEATRVHLLMLEEDGDEIPEPFIFQNLVNSKI